jgi:hypothetical protein
MSGSRFSSTIVVMFCASALAGCAKQGASDREIREAGFYPPVPSLAGEMTPEWQAFARRADRTCAIDFTAADFRVDQAYATAEQSGFGNRKTEALTESILGLAVVREAHDLHALGQPPQHAGLYRRVVSNMKRRGELRQQVSRAWLRGDSGVRSLLGARIDGMKIDFNEMGRRFGLQVCTSNGPGLETGDYPRDSGAARAAYVGGVDRQCEWRDRREEALEKHGRLHAGEILGASLGETIYMAAIGPPLGSYNLRNRILDTKRRLDRFWKSMIDEVNRSQDPDKTFTRLTPKWIRLAREVQRHLRELGLPSCSNWGPDTN